MKKSLFTAAIACVFHFTTFISVCAQDIMVPDHRHSRTDLIERGRPAHFDLIVSPSILKLARDRDISAILKMLNAQVREWNKGNIEGYMHGYWQSDSLLFIGSKGPRYGYDSTLKRYKEAYPDADHMGHLTSTITSIKKLSDEYYFVVGKWALMRNAGNVDGSFTLLLRKIKDNWVIVCDHSS